MFALLNQIVCLLAHLNKTCSPQVAKQLDANDQSLARTNTFLHEHIYIYIYTIGIHHSGCMDVEPLANFLGLCRMLSSWAYFRQTCSWFQERPNRTQIYQK